MKPLYAIVFLFVATIAASAQSTTLRDASGRIIGTSSTDSNGTRTWRDSSGRITETTTRDANGTTTFRDGAGRITGTESAPRLRPELRR